jgi:ketosteroid isomerase-like protein
MRGKARAGSFIVLLTVACVPEQASPLVDTTADVAAINAVREAEVAGLSSRDPSVGYLAADAVLMPPGEPAITGIGAIRTWAEAFIQQMQSVSVNYTMTDVHVSGDWAVERYAGTLNATTTGGEAITESLKGIHVYRREPDGSWKMVYDVWNSDAPPTAPHD